MTDRERNNSGAASATCATIAGRKTGGSRWWRIYGLSVFVIAVWWMLAWLAARALIVEAELPRADVLVVLAGSGAYMERTREAAKLFKEGRAPKIILTNDNMKSGWEIAEQRNPLFVERAAAQLERAGVPVQSIEVLRSTVASTHDEAVLLREYAEAHALHSMLVVTSAYHSRRALWVLRRVFEGSGITIGLKAVAPGEQTPAPSSWWWYRDGWGTVATEYSKQLYYWVQYG